MFSKNGSNAWTIKRPLLQGRNESNDDKWPELEKSKYLQKEKVEKPRQRLPVRNDTEHRDNGASSLSMMGYKTQKSKDVEHSFMKSLPKEGNEVIKESEEVSRTWKEKKKQAQKLFVKKKKEEARKVKQREWEESVLKKIVGPKGESISFIDLGTFSKFSSPKAAPSSSLQTNDSLSIDSSTFPELGQGLKRTPRKSFAIHGSPNNYSVPDEVKRMVDQSDGSVRKRPKPRKKKDPVVVDILQAIEICKVDKQSNKKSGIGDVKKSEKNVPRIVGNILDASNPLRHRGKKREVPKKHNMTRLKKAILLERERRRAQKDNNLSSRKLNTSTQTNQSEGGNGIVTIKVESDASQQLHFQGLQSLVLIESTDGDTCKQLSSEIVQKVVETPVEIPDVDLMVREKLHSRKLREYCNHSKSKELLEAVTLMMQDIVRFQDRTHINQPIKAESHRRYVLGLRQTQNLLSVQKVKIIILASDIEKVPSPGGLDDLVRSIIDSAKKQNVPVIFNFQRRQLGKLTYRKVPVSCIGILNYQGTEAVFHRMIAALDDAKKDYLEKFENEKSRIMNELGIPNIKKEKLEPDEQPVESEPAVTSPLLKKLTEAISEFSLQSSFKSEAIDDTL